MDLDRAAYVVHLHGSKLSFLFSPHFSPSSLPTGIWESSPGPWAALCSISYVRSDFLGLGLFHSSDQTFSLSRAMSSKVFFFLSDVWRSEAEKGFGSDGLVFDDTLKESRLGILVISVWSLELDSLIFKSKLSSSLVCDLG